MADAVIDSGGTARPIDQRVVIDGGGTARPVLAMYRVDRYEDPENPGSYLHDFYVAWTIPPQNSVPNVNLGKGVELTGPSDHELSWDAASAGTPEETYNVRIEWWVDSSLDATDTVAQDSSPKVRTYNVEQDVFCKVYYIDDDSNTGPVTTTSTI